VRNNFISLIIAACLLGSACSLRAANPFPAAATYDAAFSPRGQSLELILSAIAAAEQSILAAAYSFTSKPVAQALLEAHRRGVSVRVVADKKGNSGKYTAATFLANQGVPVRLNGRYAIHHPHA
jgi:phosphatidylserine/phosphatidylglycerophosphate/cardiolipin synthase-like enzyme